MSSSGGVMNRKAFVYNFINIIVLLGAAILFFINYNVPLLFENVGVVHILIVTATVGIVHFLKAFRLYLALYGAGLSASSYAKIYCKVTPVSILLPFKLGELFRMYCYGYQINNILKGVITVLLDRFMDTIALVTMIIAMWLYSGQPIIPLVYLLVVFLVAALVIFVVFPGLYSYWKKYLLRAKATPHKIAVLHFLDKTNLVYEEVVNVSKGRGIILYVLSLLAWATEIGCVIILNQLNGLEALTPKISGYLSSALSGNDSIELKQFILISVILMIVIYLLVKVSNTAKGERN